MSYIKRTSINMFSSTVGYVLPMLISIFTVPLLLKYLGETAYGLQSIINVIIGYLAFMDMGLDIPIIKLLSEYKAKNEDENINKLLNTTLQLYAMIGTLGFIIILCFSKLLILYVFPVPKEMFTSAVTVFQLSGIGFLASVLMSWGRAVSMGLQRFEISYSISTVTTITSTLISLYVVYIGWGLVGYIFIKVIFTVFTLPLYWIFTKKILPAYKFKLGLHRSILQTVKSYVGYGALNRVTGSFFSRIDQMLIGTWVGLEAAGIYSIPFMIVNSLGYMIAYMLGFTFPLTSELISAGKIEQFRDIYFRSSSFIAALSTMIYFPLFIFSDIFLQLWVPNIAGKATLVFKLLIVSGYLSILSAAITNNVVVGMGKIREFTIYNSIRGIFLGLFCVIFINIWGLIGAGIALVSIIIVDFTYLIIALRKYIQVSPIFLFRRAYLKPLALGGFLFIITYFFHPFITNWIRLISIVSFFEISYIALGFWIKIFGNTERKVLFSIFELVKSKVIPKRG